MADGVVQAAGYSPIIITKTATNSPTAQVVVNPAAGTVIINPNGSTSGSTQVINTAISTEIDGKSNRDVVKREKVFRKDISVVMPEKKKQEQKELGQVE